MIKTWVHLLMSAATLGALGCSGGDETASRSGGGASGDTQGQPIGSETGTPGDFGNSSSGANDNMFTADGSGGMLADFLNDPEVANCGGMAYEADPLPVDIFIVMDASGSMFVPAVGAWYTVSAAVKDFVASPEMAGVGAALNLFNNECSVDMHARPMVPMAELPGNSPPIAQTLDGYTAPIADLTAYHTNTEPALRGAVQHQIGWQQSHPDRKSVVLLVTDGFPTDECGSLDVEGAAAQGSAAGVQTFVLGIGNTFGLDAVAAAGGSGVAVVADASGQGVLDKLNEIRGRAFASCTLNFNDENVPPDGDAVRLYVTNTGDGMTYEVPRDRSSGGWTLSDDGRTAELNGTLCDEALSGLLQNLQFAIECPDVEPPPPLPVITPQ